MMMDEDVVAVSPASVYRVLSSAGVIRKWNNKQTKKGTGFKQPLKPHQDWHTDISYLNIGGTFYYFMAVLDGCSRYIVHWDIRESMTEQDVTIVIQQAREKYPDVTPNLISDNGSQYTAKEFKEYIRNCGMKHITTSPYYPQSNGKMERFHKSLKVECVRPNTPTNVEEGKNLVEKYVRYYNEERLHSSIGYVSPLDKLLGKDKMIFEARDEKLENARARRKQIRTQCAVDADNKKQGDVTNLKQVA